MTTTTPSASTFRPVGMTAADRMNVPTTCGWCDRTDLKTTVKMSAGDGVVWMGTGCAAKAMGATPAAYRSAAKVADSVKAAELATARRAEDDRKDALWSAYLIEHAGPGERTDQINRLGGFTAAMSAYCSVVA